LNVGLLQGVPTVLVASTAPYTMLADSGASVEASGELDFIFADGQVQTHNLKGKLITLKSLSNAGFAVNGKSYRGDLVLKAENTGITVVNVVPMESYLRGVVPHEIGKLGPEGLEAAKAQAVAARTYAVKHRGSRKTQGFDIYADTRDQVYEGTAGEDSLASRAIEATAGEIITYQGEPITAFYHSTCAGRTETPGIWGQPEIPYLKPVSDLNPEGRPWCEASKYMQWEVSFSGAELVSGVQANFANAKAAGVQKFGKINKVFVAERSASGRVARLVIETDKGTIEAKGDRTRQLFRKDEKLLPSDWYEVSKNGDIWTVKGKGYGHGIGMCQMGARARSAAGQNYKEILKAYYTGVEVESR
jgi:stage II sporulation protein D